MSALDPPALAAWLTRGALPCTPPPPLQSSKIIRRFDRILGRLRRYRAASIELVGDKQVVDPATGKGRTYDREYMFGGEPRVYPRKTFPSDHYGLLLTLARVHS